MRRRVAVVEEVKAARCPSSRRFRRKECGLALVCDCFSSRDESRRRFHSTRRRLDEIVRVIAGALISWPSARLIVRAFHFIPRPVSPGLDNASVIMHRLRD